LEFIELAQFSVDPSSVGLLSEPFCRKHQVVILGSVDPTGSEPVTIGLLTPDDAVLLEQLSRTLGRQVRPVQLNAYEIDKALDRGFGAKAASPSAELRPSLSAIPKLSFDPSVPVVEVLNELLASAISKRASDVHIEAYDDDADVRFRVDGVLHQITHPLGATDLKRVMARLKVLAGLDIAETRAPQDGRISATYNSGESARPIDFRLSILPGPHGEDAVLRILDPARQLVGLSELGLSPEHLAVLRELERSPEGMFLVTGPTGSGKTTTLYAILSEIHSSETKVLTVEDPIEYRIAKVNQKQVTAKLGFAEYARALLRQDPDVLLIGEIRDEDTADVAVRAAQTGHLVLSTVHTNDSVSTLRRLSVLGVESENIASTLFAVLAQRLLRKLCPICRGAGCAACDQAGYRGRTGLYELFVPDDELSEMISRGDSVGSIRKAARAKGMQVLVEDGLRKVAEGVTSAEELARSISYRLMREQARG
jgi:type II secretory ATPase GspE/PulE/Tfp pilus assembly ATPase PilB-like protein